MIGTVPFAGFGRMKAFSKETKRAPVGRGGRPPELAHGMHIIVRARAPVLEGHRRARRTPSRSQPTPMPSSFRPARHRVQGGDLLGGDDGIVLRQDQDGGAEADALRMRRRPGHPDQRVRHDEFRLVAGHPAAGRIGVGGPVSLRHHGVLDGPGGFKPRRLAGLQQGYRLRRVGVASGIAIAQCEFSSVPSPFRSSSSMVLRETARRKRRRKP